MWIKAGTWSESVEIEGDVAAGCVEMMRHCVCILSHQKLLYIFIIVSETSVTDQL